MRSAESYRRGVRTKEYFSRVRRSRPDPVTGELAILVAYLSPAPFHLALSGLNPRKSAYRTSLYTTLGATK